MLSSSNTSPKKVSKMRTAVKMDLSGIVGRFFHSKTNEDSNSCLEPAVAIARAVASAERDRAADGREGAVGLLHRLLVDRLLHDRLLHDRLLHHRLLVHRLL